MATVGFEDLEVYRLSERLADAVWDLVARWRLFARDTVGRQLVRAADSIGANIVEGSGRGTYKDNAHFARVARGSLNEARHFLRRAYRRRLLTRDQTRELRPIIAELAPRLNAYVRSIASQAKAPSRSRSRSSNK